MTIVSRLAFTHNISIPQHPAPSQAFHASHSTHKSLSLSSFASLRQTPHTLRLRPTTARTIMISQSPPPTSSPTFTCPVDVIAFTDSRFVDNLLSSDHVAVIGPKSLVASQLVNDAVIKRMHQNNLSIRDAIQSWWELYVHKAQATAGNYDIFSFPIQINNQNDVSSVKPKVVIGKVVGGILPEYSTVSRHCSHLSPQGITATVEHAASGGAALLPSTTLFHSADHPIPHKAKKSLGIVLLIQDPADAIGAITAVAKALGGGFSAKSSSNLNSPSTSASSIEKDKNEQACPQNILVSALVLDSANNSIVDLPASNINLLHAALHGTRLTSFLVDCPCNYLNTNNMVEVSQSLIHELKTILNSKSEATINLSIDIKRMNELEEKGFGGISAVGRAAARYGREPALIILGYHPTPLASSDDSKNNPQKKNIIALVGKGIVFDTGGLAIKSRVSMAGMKNDMGGAAAVLGAFRTFVLSGVQKTVYAVLCCAENAIGADAFLHDDILTMYSGKTVEINNTDAEGRLVLADGVYYAAKDLHATTIIDIATLTGAQGIATGSYHAALLANNEKLEQIIVDLGKKCGEMVFPVLYYPEIHRKEFRSSVADMKNSVANRSNAQVSCAGSFIESHLPNNFGGNWAHIDMAALVMNGSKASGWGAALLSQIAINLE